MYKPHSTKIANYIFVLFTFTLFLVSCGSSDSFPEKGRWESENNYTIQLSRAQEESFDYMGDSENCYGIIDLSNEDFLVSLCIRKVGELEANRLPVYYESSNEMRWNSTMDTPDTLIYNPEKHNLVMASFSQAPFHVVGGVDQSGNSATTDAPKGPSTFMMILGAIVGIVVLVLGYYLFKIILGYVLFTAISAGAGAFIAFLITIKMSSQVQYYSVLITAIVFGLIGLIIAIFGTKGFVKAPFASRIAKEMGKSDPNGTGYTITDEYGNKKKVKKTGTGILGEDMLAGSDGKKYKKDWGSNHAEEI